MRTVLLASFFLLFSVFSTAQSYTTAIGLKGGSLGWGYGGVNLKHFFAGNLAVDATLGGGLNYLQSSVLLEWQHDTGITPGLEWYFGFGAITGGRSGNFNVLNKNYTTGFFLSARGVVGLEYIVQEIPINVALDLGPHFGIINNNRIGFGSAVAIRYYF